MSTSSLSIVSDYLAHRKSLEDLRWHLVSLDWDDVSLVEDTRSILLQTEAFLAGIDEGYNDEAELRAFLANALAEPSRFL